MLVSVGEIASFQKGYPFKSEDYVDSGCKIIRVTNLNRNEYNDENCLFIEESKYGEYERFALHKDDIVISTVGSWPSNPLSVVGKVTVIPERIEGCLLNQNAVRIRAQGDCTQDFLIYVLMDEKFKQYIIGSAQGSAKQASIKIEDIKRFEFELPPKEQQIKMVSILRSIDKRIELNNDINDKLIEIRNTLLPEIMSGGIAFEDIDL